MLKIKTTLFVLSVIVALIAADLSSAVAHGEVETLPVAKFLTTATSASASNSFVVEGYVDGQEYNGFYRWPATRFDLDR